MKRSGLHPIRAVSRASVSRRAICGLAAALVTATLLHTALHAQSAGANVAVLPVVQPVNPNDPASVFDAAYISDLFLNRQVEPTVAVSTRNPQHVLTFFNDYRAVNIQDDLGLGETQTGVFLSAWNFVKQWLARLGGRRPQRVRAMPDIAAASEAWIGGSRSYDNGLTWSGMFLPGALFDNSFASQNSPVRGLAAATDPVLAAAPCGKFYVAFLAFTRLGESRMAIATYEDLNNNQGGDTIVYLNTQVVETANNGQWGYFLDKPAIAVDPHRGANAGCGHNVYVTYTTFNGQTKDQKVQTKVTLARSTDSGQTYNVQKLNMPYQQGQGTAIAVDPRDGTPTTTGGGTLYIAWRHFFDPDTILIHKSTNYGNSFAGQPVDLLSASSIPQLQKFDQPTLSTTNTTDPPAHLAFRSLAFPTIAVTETGTVMVAWQERVDIDPNSPTFRKPLAGGTPRIVLMRSTNGSTWTDINGVVGSRLAADVGKRDLPEVAPAAGLGFLPQLRDSGPQVMPYLSFAGGKLMMLYYESRGFMVKPPNEAIQPADLTPLPGPNFITGIDRLFDVRAALLDTSTGAVAGSAQVSRYPLKAFASFANGEGLDDVAPVNAPCTTGSGIEPPDYAPAEGEVLAPCERRVNRTNKPTSAAGTSPFMGDYVGLTPAVQLIPTPDGSGWRWAVNSSDVPSRAFHSVFADNRNLVPPTTPASAQEWQRYTAYGPPYTSTCQNGASRNTDVHISKIDADLIVTAPTTFTQLLNIQRTFPVVVANGTAAMRYFRLTFATGGTVASFLQEADLNEQEVQVFPYSSATRVVYVEPVGNTSVKVLVQEITGPGGDVVAGGLTGNVTLNGDASNPLVVNSGIANTETHNPEIGAPEIGAPEIGAPEIGAPEIGAPEIGAPEIGATAPSEYVAYQDTTWTATNLGNTNSAYTVAVHVDNPSQYSGQYAFQLIVHKTSGFGELSGCTAGNGVQNQIITVVPNPEIGAPEIGAPEIGAPEIGAVTFAVGPSDSTQSSSALSVQGTDQATPKLQVPAASDNTLKAPKAPEVVKITLRAYQIVQNPTAVFNPSLIQPVAAVSAQSKNNLNGVLENPPVAAFGADLTITSGVPSATPMTVQAGGSVQFPAAGWTLSNIGNVDALAADGSIQHSVYLSTDNTFGMGDVFLGVAGTTTVLGAGATQSFGASSISIPAGTMPGTYYLFVVADDGSQTVNGEVSELDELNNASAAALLTVVIPNVAPEAANQSLTTAEDIPLAVTLTATDANNDALTFTVLSQPTNGTLSGTAPNLAYTPNANFHGADSFTFRASDGALDSNTATVAIAITAVNDAPLASNQAVSVAEDGSQAITLAASDVDSVDLSYSIVAGPAYGTLSGTPPSVTYTPNANYSGTDEFTFKANDGALDSNTATVAITVTGVNDAPVASANSYSTNEDTPLVVAAPGVLGNDTDVDANTLTAVLVAGPAHGALTLNADGSFSYTPAGNYNGADSFSYKASDGVLDSNVAVVSITINAVNDAPVANDQAVSTAENTAKAIALTAIDVDSGALAFTILTQPAHGTLTGTAPNVTYTPAFNYVGADTFTFRASDGLLNSNTATVAITVTQGIDYFGFNGLLSPYQAPPRSANLGSSAPIAWQYTNALTGAIVDTSTADPTVTFTKMKATNTTCTSPAGEEIPVEGSTLFTNMDTPGNSYFSYTDGTWKFNWQTVPPVTAGCWNVRVILNLTGQVNGPFPLRLVAK